MEVCASRFDTSLIEDAKRGKQDAYTALLKNNKRLVQYYVWQFIHNQEDVNDITQEVFIKAFSNLDTYKHIRTFQSWLKKITVNTCLDFIGKKKIDTIGLDGVFNYSQKTKNPEELLILKESSEKIDICLEKLRPLFRRLIEMYYFENKKLREISTELDMPMGTIQPYIKRAKMLLSKLYNDEIDSTNYRITAIGRMQAHLS